MADRLEAAASGRAQCRACGAKIEKGALRFGEELPNSYGDGGMSVYWFHPRCAAHRRPEKLAALLRSSEAAAAALPDADQLLSEADVGVAHPNLARIAGGERAPTGRARCRHCNEPIAGGTWRIRLSSFADSGFFDPLGFIHAACARAYLAVSELGPVGEHIRQATPELDAAAVDEILASALAGPGSP
jgi:hypothetical protein